MQKGWVLNMTIPENAKQAVEEIQSFLNSQGIILTKEQTFQKLIEYNMLDEVGNPTAFALENGLAEII